MDAVIGDLEREIEADLEGFNVPGASWALIEDGRIVHVRGLGLVAADGGDSVTPATLFQACSVSKPVAVLAMLRLVDRGVVDLDEDVNNSLTSWRVRPTADWQPVVTLRQLASHSAGLTTSGFPGYKAGEMLPATVEILDGTGPANTFGVRVDTVPGLQFRYSGGGTMVMQQVLEDITGTPLRELVRELVLEPLQMSDSDYVQPLPETLHDRAATAHDEAGRPIEGRWHIYPELAAAGLWTTPRDLARYAIGIQRAYAGADGALLSPALAHELLKPHMAAGDRDGGLDHVGLGLFLGGAGLASRFGHQGGNEGFRCHLLAYRDTGQGAALMTNGNNGNWIVQRAFARIAASRCWPDYPDEPAESDLPGVRDLIRVEGTYELNGKNLTVVRDGGHLLVRFEGQRAIEFQPLSSDTFAGRTVDATLHFESTGDKATMTVAQNGSTISCARLST